MFLRQLLQPLLAGTLDFVAIIRRYVVGTEQEN